MARESVLVYLMLEIALGMSTRAVVGSAAVFVCAAALCATSLTSCGGNTASNGSTTDTGGSNGDFGGSMSATGGSSSAYVVSTSATGGVASSPVSSSPRIERGDCTSDGDCTLCTFGTAPADTSECDYQGYSCCGDTIATSYQQCDINTNAWKAYCQVNHLIPCPCIAFTCSSSCVDGYCSGSCTAD
jgi:hypothetical protein